jgi:hypothetical protein
MREEIKDWNTEDKFRDIEFRLPEIKNNPWFKFVQRNFQEAEDPSQRAPPLAEIFDDAPAETQGKSPYYTKISLINATVPMRCYLLRGGGDGQ